MDKKRVKNIIWYMKQWRYVVYEQPYKLNIIGIRSASTQANAFDDELLVFWYDAQRTLQWRVYRISTDPGTYWLHNPMEALGAAILKGGQYVDAYQLIQTSRFGFPTQEFLQSKPVTIIRDYNRDAVLDFYNGRETTGMYGINIHTGANPNQTSLTVDKWSAGCQVFASWTDWQDFLVLANRHVSMHGNSFSYTLLDSRATWRASRRYGVYAVGIGALATAIYFATKI